MDSISSFELATIFGRLPDSIDLKGKFSAEEIEKELIKFVKKCKKLRRKVETISERKKIKRTIINIRRLLEYGFSERVIDEANANPKGIFAMTLKFGKKEAKRRILAQKRAHIRARLRRKRKKRC